MLSNRKMSITNTQVWGLEMALKGMRNPKNSWDRADSVWCCFCEEFDCVECPTDKCPIVDGMDSASGFVIGENDMNLATTLIKAGNEHSKFLRMVHVQADFDMPRYWWSEADTYHFGTKNSCSTMHKLLNNAEPITLDMFVTCEEDEDIAELVVARLESLRKEYREVQVTTKDSEHMERLLLRAKRLLMEGFLQMRTWDTSYAEIRNIYHQRKNHRLKEEWVDTFCKWAESLPYAKEFIIS